MKRYSIFRRIGDDYPKLHQQIDGDYALYLDCVAQHKQLLDLIKAYRSNHFVSCETNPCAICLRADNEREQV